MAKYKGRGDHVEPWEQVFLATYTEKGGKRLSAKDAGVTWERVRMHIDDSPRFRALWEAAAEEHGETLERMMLAMASGGGHKNAFLPLMARLKGELPQKYNDKLQVSGVVAHAHGAPEPAVVNALLREMLGDARPETKASLAAPVTIIEGEAERIDQ